MYTTPTTQHPPSRFLALPSSLPPPRLRSESSTDDGRVYYYNRITKETAWTAPAGWGGAAAGAAASGGGGGGGADWVSAETEDGRTYYYNKTTKETSWTKPEGQAGVRASVAGELDLSAYDIDAMAMGIDAAEVEKFKTAFLQCDMDGDGTIDAAELDVVMRQIGQVCNAEELRQMIAEVDDDGSGQFIYYDYLFYSMTEFFTNLNIIMLDKKGSIEFGEFCQLMKNREDLGDIFGDLANFAAEFGDQDASAIMETVAAEEAAKAASGAGGDNLVFDT